MNNQRRKEIESVLNELADLRSRIETIQSEEQAALLWTLWHHQGGSSHIGQPIRKLLGIGQHDRLTDEQIAEAKAFGGAA